MSADVLIGSILILLGLIVFALLALARAAAKRKPRDTPRLERKFYQCAQRDCTARATHIVLMVSSCTESRVVCWEDCQRLVRVGHAVNLGPLDRGR